MPSDPRKAIDSPALPEIAGLPPERDEVEKTHPWLASQLDFFWGAFVSSFCLRLLLPALLLFVLDLMIGGHVGASYGIHGLVFHDETFKQFWVGATLGLLSLNTLLVGFLLWRTDLARRARQGSAQRAQEAARAGVVVEESEREESPATAPSPTLRHRRWHRAVQAFAIAACLVGTVGAVWEREASNLGSALGGLRWLVLTLLLGGAGTLYLLRLLVLRRRVFPAEQGFVGWSFFGYASGILTWLFGVLVVVFLLLGMSAKFSSIYGLENQSIQDLLLPGTTATSAGDAQDYLPLVAGLIGGALMFWGIVTVAISPGVSSRLLAGWRWLQRVERGAQSAGRQLDQPAVAPRPDEGGNTRYNVFLTVLVFFTVGVYLLVVAPLASKLSGWGMPFALGTLLVLGALALARRIFPSMWGMLTAAIAENTRMPRGEDYRYNGAAALLVLFMILYHTALYFSPLWDLRDGRLGWNSPIVVISCFLQVVVAVYGLLAYLARRIVPIVLAGLVLLVVFSGIPTHKFRFDGLPGDKQPPPRGFTIEVERGDGTIEHTDVLDLMEHAASDSRYQKEFDQLLLDLEKKQDDLLRRVLPEPVLACVAARAAVGAVTGPLAPLASSGILEGQWGFWLQRLEAEAEPLKTWWDTEEEKLRPRLEANRVRPWIDLSPAASFPKARGLFTPEELELQSGEKEGAGQEPLVVIAVSGGGLRSAVWTLRVLQELEKGFGVHGIDFPSRVRVICGASGGMLGAAYYVATLPPREQRLKTLTDREAKLARQKQMEKHRESLAKDFLTPLVQRGVFNDLPSFFSPYPNMRDRGKALEEAWGEELGNASPMFCCNQKRALDLTFADLQDAEKKGDCPSLVFSPMMVEDGRRLLISNLDLRYVAANTGNRLGTENSGQRSAVPYSIEALELFRMFPEAKEHFKLSTAVRMSATFPYFTPAVSLPTSPRRRVVDAGYYDNYGVSLAASWLFSGSNGPWIAAKASKIVLIQIRDSVSDPERTLYEVPPEDSRLVHRAIEELSSPPEGLYNSVFAAASFRNDGQLELLSAYYRANELKIAANRFDAEVNALLKTDPVQKDRNQAAALRGQIIRLLQHQARSEDHKGPRFQEQALNVIRGFPLQDPDHGPDKVWKVTRRWLGTYFSDPLSQPRPPHEARYFTTMTFEFPGKAALSWYLSSQDRREIANAISGGNRLQPGATNVPKSIDALARWWKTPPQHGSP
jgi:hypothetical protein